MTIRIYTFEGAQLGGAVAACGEAVPALTKRVIVAASLVNTSDTTALSATVYLVPAGGTPGAANTRIYNHVLAPGETYLCPELINHGLGPGGTVQALGAGLAFHYTAKDIVNG